MRTKLAVHLFVLTLGCMAVHITASAAQSVYDAIIVEPDQKTQEVSTAQMRSIMADGSAIVLDTRPHAEYVNGHIPGAQNLKVPAAEAVAAVEQLVQGDKAKAIVLYCNGPFCQASRRMGNQLLAAGFTNVRRYQLGMPVWRALGGPTAIELEGVARIFKNDQTAVFFDARPAEAFSKGSVAKAKSVPAEAYVAEKLKDVPFPLDDFNTRIILFGSEGAQAQMLADALSKRPWHNVLYFPGTFDELQAELAKP